MSPSVDFGPLVTATDGRPQLHPSGVGLRTVDSADLRARLHPSLSAYGITRVANITGFDLIGLPVHIAAKPQGATLASGSGKGLTPDGSWVSGVMEACEQAVWERLVLDPRYGLDTMQASARSMARAGLRTVQVSDLPWIRGAVWGDDLSISWTPGWDIVRGQEVWIPTSCVTPAVVGNADLRPFVSSSNGLASGAHVLEAILSALLEVIERDGVRLHTRAVPRPPVDVQQASDVLAEANGDVAELLQRSGLPMRVIDCTTELGLPTFAAYLYDAPDQRVGSFRGSGTALTSERALLRAVTEAAQSRCLVIAGARDDIFELERASGIQTLRALPPQASADYPDVIDLQTGSLEGDIGVIVQRLVDCGFDSVIVIRHTDPAELVQVVRVVVPGLEGIDHHSAAIGRRFREHRERAGR